MLYLYGAIAASLAMDVLIKIVSDGVQTWTMVALRWGVALLFLTPFAIKHFTTADWNPLRRVHFSRALLNVIGTFCFFHSLQTLQLPVAVTIFFAEPLFTTLFAVMLGRESVSWRGWIMTFVGFLGVILVAIGDPNQHYELGSVLNGHAAVAVAGAVAWGLMTVLTKRYGGAQSSLCLVFWLAALTSLISFPIAGGEIFKVSPSDAILIAGAAALGSIYSILWVAALKVMPASLATTGLYLTLPCSFIIGFVLFQEIPTGISIFGGIIVFIGVVSLTNDRLRAVSAQAIIKVWRRFS